MAISVPTVLTPVAVVGAGTTTTIVIPIGGVPQGQRLIVSFCANLTNSDASPTCADSKGNPYSTDEEYNEVGNNLRVVTFSAPINVALVSGDTVTVTCISASRRCIAARYSNVAAKEQSKQNNNANASPTSGNTAARSNASTLLVGTVGWRTATAAELASLGAGFSRLSQVESSGAASSRYIAVEDQIMSVAGGVDPTTFTLSIAEVWGINAVVYPEAGVGGGGGSTGRSDVDAIADVASITIAA